MIERYTRPEMGELWTLNSKYQTWLDVEIAACEAWAEEKQIPKSALKEIKNKAVAKIRR